MTTFSITFLSTKMEAKDVYQDIRNDFIKFLQSLKIDEEFTKEESISQWLFEYGCNMTTETKIAVYIKYGYEKVLMNLSEVALDNGYFRFEGFIQDMSDASEGCVIRYIMEKEIINEINIDDYL